MPLLFLRFEIDSLRSELGFLRHNGAASQQDSGKAENSNSGARVRTGGLYRGFHGGDNLVVLISDGDGVLRGVKNDLQLDNRSGGLNFVGDLRLVGGRQLGKIVTPDSLTTSIAASTCPTIASAIRSDSTSSLFR